MNKQDLMKWGLIAGGAYLAYWYVNNHGPNGPVFDATGNKISLSYWDGWFGTAPQPATVTQMPVQTQTTLPQQSIPQTAPVVTAGPDIRTLIATQSAGDANMASGTASAWQWNYYYKQNTVPLTDVQFNAAFPDPAQPITLDGFLAHIHGIGLSGQVDTLAVPQVPSMSFGGGQLASMWKRKGTIN